MESSAQQLIESLHRDPFRYLLALTGGGAQAAGWLLTVPGASRTILEVLVPYYERALADFLGRVPKHSCSPETAIDLALRAERRAAWLAPCEDVLGVGCTASLATDRPKHGGHRFHLALSGLGRLRAASLTLTKGARDRAGEEDVRDRVLLNELARAAGAARRPEAAAVQAAVEGGADVRLAGQLPTPGRALRALAQNVSCVLPCGLPPYNAEAVMKPLLLCS
jgi:hypothetical protein